MTINKHKRQQQKEKAFRIFMRHNGNVSLQAIANQVGIDKCTISKWITKKLAKNVPSRP